MKEIILHTFGNMAVSSAPEKKALLWLAKKLPAGFTRIISPYWACFHAGRRRKLLGRQPEQICVDPRCGCACRKLAWGQPGRNPGRVRNCQRPRYGYYVDHVIDLFGTAALLGGWPFPAI